jgi:hypothetical protein
MAEQYEGNPLEQEMAIDVPDTIQFDDEHHLVEDDTEVAKTQSDEEDEKESYSKRVQARINKLAYERNIERDKTARMEAELQAMRERLDALANAKQEDNQSTVEQQRQDLIQRKKDALYISDFDSVAEIDEQLLELKLKTAPTANKEPPPPDLQQTQQPQQPAPPDALVQWEAKNPWLYDARQTARKDKANQVFMKMINEEGYDLEDPDTYEALDRRLKRSAPPPVGAPDRGQVNHSANDYVFTPEIKEQMRGFGLDPNNAAQRVEWALNHK